MATRGLITCALLLITVPTAVYPGNTWVPMPETQVEYFHDDTRQVTWHSARAQCIQLGADLISIHNQNQTDFIVNKVSSYGCCLWTGLNKLDGAYQWSDGSSYGDYTPWDDDQPEDDVIGRDCVYMTQSSKKWLTANCGASKGDVLCQRQTGVTPTSKTDSTTPNVPGYCPLGYIDAGTKCYKLFSMTMAVTWEEALTECRNQPGRRPDLASFHSSTDNAFVTSQLQPASPPLWIGSRRKEYAWVWSDNSDTNYNNRKSGDGKCLSMASSRPLVPGDWIPQDCATKRGYICQIHKDRNDVIHTPGPTSAHPCMAGFTPHGDGCYRFEAKAATWSEAEAACEAGGSHLVAIHTEMENAMVQVITGGADVWIGLKKGGSGEYSWSNGEYVIYTRWAENPLQQDCIKMQSKDGLWTGKNCNMKLPYICKISTGPALTTPPQIEGKCPPEGDWIAHGSYCYKFILSPVRSWYTALDACPTHYYKASLVSIHHVVDNDWLYRQVLKLCKESNACFSLNSLYIGLHRSRKDGTLRWVDGSPLEFTHWSPERPHDEDCVVMSNTDKSMWAAASCEATTAGYICKVPKAPMPTHPTEAPGKCLNEAWDGYGASCFLYKPDETTRWTEAQALCQASGGYLASILSEHENDYIYEMMMSHTHLPKPRPFWIGAVRLNTSSLFGWLGGAAMSYSHWGQGFPKTPGANCVTVDELSTVWKNKDCQKRAGVICRYDKVTTSSRVNNKGLSGGAVAGIVIGVLAFISLIFVAAAYLVLVRRHPARQPIFNNTLSRTVTTQNGSTNLGATTNQDTY